MTNKFITDMPKVSMKNKKEIEQSQNCGCYHCAEIFPASSVIEWTDQKQTGICPNCKVDSVVPDSKHELNVDLLKQAQKYWF